MGIRAAMAAKVGKKVVEKELEEMEVIKEVEEENKPETDTEGLVDETTEESLDVDIED